MIEWVLFAFGIYIGVGMSIGTYFYVDDDPWTDERHWIGALIGSVIVSFVWGPVFAWIIVTEEIL